jgi:hypothetical protein
LEEHLQGDLQCEENFKVFQNLKIHYFQDGFVSDIYYEALRKNFVFFPNRKIATD